VSTPSARSSGERVGKPRKDTLARLADALSLSERERASLDAATMHRWPGAAFYNAGSPISHQSERALRLVGRSRELALMERFLMGEGGPVLAMAGEPGIGKTRLLEETATRAQALARVANDQGLLVRALSRRATFLSERVGQVESGLAVAEEMIPLAEAAGDLWSLVGALNSVAEFYKYSGQNGRARPYFARAVAAAEQSGDPADLAFVLVTQGDNESPTAS
jgi:hypothetical protein